MRRLQAPAVTAAGAHRIFWVLAFFFPPLPALFGDFYQGQRFAVAVIVIASVGLVCMRALTRGGLPVPSSGLYAVAFSLLASGYFAFTTLLFSPTVAAVDLIDVFRPLTYVALLLFPLLVRVNAEEEASLLRFVLLLFGLQAVISAGVFLQPLWPLMDMYKGRLSADMDLASVAHFYRFSGTFGWPASFALQCAFFALILFALQAAKSRPKFPFRTLLFILGAGVVFSGSRSGIAVFGLTTAISLLALGLYRRADVLLILIVLATGGVLAVVAFSEQFAAFQYVMMLVERGGQDDSASYRLIEFSRTWELFVRHFPFGVGAQKDYFREFVGPFESAHSFYFGKFGLFGGILWLAQYVLLGVAALRLRYDRIVGPEVRAVAFAILVWCALVPIFVGLLEAVTDEFRGPVMFYPLAGYLLAAAARARESEEAESRVVQGLNASVATP